MASEYDALLESTPAQQKSEYDQLLSQPSQPKSSVLGEIGTAIKNTAVGFVKGLARPPSLAEIALPIFGGQIERQYEHAKAAEQAIHGGQPAAQSIAQAYAPNVSELASPEATRAEKIQAGVNIGAEVAPFLVPALRGIGKYGVAGRSLSDIAFGAKPEPLRAETAAAEQIQKGGEISATQERVVKEGNIPKYPGDDTGRASTKTGGRGGNAPSPQAEAQAPQVAPAVPQPEQAISGQEISTLLTESGLNEAVKNKVQRTLHQFTPNSEVRFTSPRGESLVSRDTATGKWRVTEFAYDEKGTLSPQRHDLFDTWEQAVTDEASNLNTKAAPSPVSEGGAGIQPPISKEIKGKPPTASATVTTGTGEAPTERISWGTPLEVDRSGLVTDVRQQLQKGDYAIGVRYIPEAQVNRYFTGKVVKVGKNWVDVEYKGKVERINEKLSKLTENDGRIIEQSQQPAPVPKAEGVSQPTETTPAVTEPTTAQPLTQTEGGVSEEVQKAQDEGQGRQGVLAPEAATVQPPAAVPAFAQRFNPDTLLVPPKWAFDKYGKAFEDRIFKLVHDPSPMAAVDITPVWKVMTPAERQELVSRGFSVTNTRTPGQVALLKAKDAIPAQRYFRMQEKIASREQTPQIPATTESATAATLPKEEVVAAPPETPEELGQALKEPPKLAGVSNRVLQERYARGEIPQAPESGKGVLKEDLIRRANEIYSPERVQVAAEKVMRGEANLDDHALVTLQEEKLTKIASDAERAMKANPNDPVLRQAYDEAVANQQQWEHEVVPPMKLLAHNQMINLQGATNVDTGTLVGLQKLAWDTGKGDFTPEQRPIMDEAANRVSAAEAAEKSAIVKANETAQKILKPKSIFNLNELRESLQESLKTMTC